MRLFATLTPPASIRAALLATMHGIDGARWQAEEQLHLTLRFCGEVAESDVPLLAAELRRVAFAPFPLCIAGVGHFEKKNRVHTVWAGVEAGEELFALQRRIEAACQRAGLEAEGRRFTPHITLARGSLPGAAVAPFLSDHALLSTPAWQVEGFALYESTLTPNGARYTPLAEFEGS
ncbi:MAG: RNA 2',3'-cyclic phosphodiesterase [Sphingomonadaceae bacterium]|nr:RNA 2',3'-cyclic phosphodiesterase [Sphingomonadaceae bacterium]